jgi:Histidine kinase-, DNA gyrase B-, and HSP90-like ATPase
VDNAIKFTPPEGSVMVRAHRVEADPDSVYLSVNDSGRGINPDTKTMIFERLYQDPEAVDNNRSGLGLGLFICREIVRLHGGRIWASGEPGQGSTFNFTLPLYSLGKLLAPVITYQERLRPSFVLVRVDLVPLSDPPRGNWKETWQQGLEILRRCVYLNKDLVLPPMGTSGAAETFLVVASTTMQQSGIMATRIREQLERIPDLNTKCSVRIMAAPIELPPTVADESLEQQVQRVDGCITRMILASMDRKQSCAAKAAKNSNRQFQLTQEKLLRGRDNAKTKDSGSR